MSRSVKRVRDSAVGVRSRAIDQIVERWKSKEEFNSRDWYWDIQDIESTVLRRTSEVYILSLRVCMEGSRNESNRIETNRTYERGTSWNEVEL